MFSVLVYKVLCKVGITLFAGCLVKPHQGQLQFRVSGRCKCGAFFNPKHPLNIVGKFAHRL